MWTYLCHIMVKEIVFYFLIQLIVHILNRLGHMKPHSIQENGIIPLEIQYRIIWVSFLRKCHYFFPMKYSYLSSFSYYVAAIWFAVLDTLKREYAFNNLYTSMTLDNSLYYALTSTLVARDLCLFQTGPTY